MEGVYEELDQAKAEIENLREELRRKSELSESLRKSYNDQIRKSQEASLKLEKQAQEISEKSEEISELKRVFEEARVSLNENDSGVKHLRAENERLRSDCNEKLKRLEEVNKGLVLALEESNERSFDQEQRILEYREEIESLKGCLSVSRKKKECLEAEMTCDRSKEAREREDALLGLEEMKRKIEVELKWKKEQFCHLEEAHRKAKAQFKASEEEWVSERSSLLDEIGSLETRFDAQTRISEDLKNQLQMCNRALAREETQRKSLEAQISDLKSGSENVFGESQPAFRESQTKKASGGSSPSVVKLRNKLKCSEQTLKETTASLNSQIETMKRELSDFGSRLERRDETINELREELKRKSKDSAKVKAEMGKVEAELESRDAVIEELRMALENFHARENEWKLSGGLKEKYVSELESKEETIAGLRIELDRVHEDYLAKEAEKSSQLEKVKNALSNYRSLLESRDAKIKELGLELEQFLAQEAKLKYQLARKEQAVKELEIELDRVHEDYLAKLGDKEAEKSSQLEKVTKDLSNCRSLLESRDAKVKELGLELEQFLAQEAKLKSRVNDLEKSEYQLVRKQEAMKELKIELEQQKEDFCTNLTSKEAEAISQLENAKSDLDKYGSLLESKDAEIKKLKAKEAEGTYQLDMLSKDLEKCRSEQDYKDSRIEELQTDLDNCRSSILELKLQHEEEISVTLLVLKNGISDAQLKIVDENTETESVSKKILKRVHNELERAKSELAEKICRANGAEFELYIWKSIAERFKVSLDESLETRSELEASLVAQVIFGEDVEEEKRQLLQDLAERDKRIEDLQRRLLENEEEGSKVLGFVDERVGEISNIDKNLMEILESIVTMHCQQRDDSSVTEKENVNNNNNNSPTMTTKFESSSEIRSPFREIN